MNWNAYHFVSNTLRDGTPIPPDGETLKFAGEISMCRAGFHASRKVWQALPYASGNTLCRVHCAGEIIESDDKLVCTERTIIARRDVTNMLQKYARLCALDAIHLWDAPDVVRKFLKTGDEKMSVAAKYAAWGTSSEPAWSKTEGEPWWDAAAAAARAATWDAAIAAVSGGVFVATVRDAAWDAAFAVTAAKNPALVITGVNAMEPAMTKQRARLTRMTNQLFEDAT